MMEVTYFMQLIYLWLDMKNRGIDNLEIQLSPNHHCKFDYKKKSLEIKFEASNINIFSNHYPEISNVSVIVGENGCGKTTILKELFDLLRCNSQNSLYLAVYFDDEMAFSYVKKKEPDIMKLIEESIGKHIDVHVKKNETGFAGSDIFPDLEELIKMPIEVE